MITISLWQPHASAMFVPRPDDPNRMLKGFETRHWAPSFNKLKPGQLLAIHAAKTERDPETGESIRDWWINRVKLTVYSSAFAASGIHDWTDLPFGAVIGYGIFLGATRTEELIAAKRIDQIEEHWGNYGPKRYGWHMDKMVRLARPSFCRGRQSLFAWSENRPPNTSDAL